MVAHGTASRPDSGRGVSVGVSRAAALRVVSFRRVAFVAPRDRSAPPGGAALLLFRFPHGEPSGNAARHLEELRRPLRNESRHEAASHRSPPMNTYLDPRPTSLPAAAIPVAPPPGSTDRSARYRAILQRRIDDGTKRAAEILASIQRDQPRDQNRPHAPREFPRRDLRRPAHPNRRRPVRAHRVRARASRRQSGRPARLPARSRRTHRGRMATRACDRDPPPALPPRARRAGPRAERSRSDARVAERSVPSARLPTPLRGSGRGGCEGRSRPGGRRRHRDPRRAQTGASRDPRADSRRVSRRRRGVE